MLQDLDEIILETEPGNDTGVALLEHAHHRFARLTPSSFITSAAMPRPCAGMYLASPPPNRAVMAALGFGYDLRAQSGIFRSLEQVMASTILGPSGI